MPCLDANAPATSRLLKRRAKAWQTVYDLELCGADLKGLSIRIVSSGLWDPWTIEPVKSSSVAWPLTQTDADNDGA